jgi:hypothetical protein
VFHVTRLPDPVSYVGTHCGTSTITKPELLNCSALICKMMRNGVNLPYKFEVVSFEFTATNEGKIIALSCMKEAFTKEMKDIVQKVKSGSKVFFDNVKAKGQDGVVRNVPGITLVVK